MRVAVLMVALSLGIAPSYAQLQMPDNPVEMSSAQFEKLVFDAAANQRANAVSQYCSAMIQRLRQEKFTTDRTVMRCAAHLINAGTVTPPAASSERIEAAQKDLAAIVALVPGRPYLAAQVLEKMGSLSVLNGDFAKAADYFKRAVEALEPLKLDMDLSRVSTLVNLGQSLLSIKKKSEADRYFLLAMAYPWYTVVGNPQMLTKLQDQYLLAGRGLIESRRGNLQALNQISFVPAMKEDLDPPLQRAIEEAKTQH